MALSISDLENSGLYLDSIVKNQIILDGDAIDVIEGVLTSFNMHKINFSYNILHNKVHMSYFDNNMTKDVSLVEMRVNSAKDFEEALTRADKNLYKYLANN